MTATSPTTVPPRPAARAIPWRIVVTGLALVALACAGSGGRRSKPPAPAVWSDAPALAGLDLADLDRLREAGAGEVFLEAVRLAGGPDGAPALVVVPDLAAVHRLPVTLVVGGDGPLSAVGEEPAAAARRLGEGLRAAALGAERAGLIPIGFHVAPRLAAGEEALAAYADVLAALRREIDPRLFLSADLDRRRLGDPAARRLAGAADFLVAFLYGQRPGEPEDADAWDLDAVERGARALEALGGDYWVGAVTLGGATVVDAAGTVSATVAATSLARLAGDPALALGNSLALERGSRQVTVFTAARATRVAEARVAAGQRVRVVRPTPADLLELSRRLAGLNLAHYRGEILYRLPAPGEGLSLPAGALAHVLRGEEPPPELAVELTPRGGAGEQRLFTVTVTNRGSLPTGIARYDHNYVEVTVRGGAVVAVAPGSFRRYSLVVGGREPASMREARNADAARLFVPVLDAGEAVTSGLIDVRGSGGRAPLVVAGGRFVVAGGGVVELPTVEAP